jgi:hypothetical protein
MQGIEISFRLRDQGGVAAIEFAIVLPVLVILLCGIIEFSIAYYNKAMITNASREGARAGIAYDDVIRLTEAEIGEIVNKYAAEHLITFGDSHDPVTVTDPIDGDPPASGLLRVTVSYRYDFLIFPQFVSDMMEDFLNLTCETVMMYEGES